MFHYFLLVIVLQQQSKIKIFLTLLKTSYKKESLLLLMHKGKKMPTIKADRISSFGTTVFTVWTNLAKQYDAINLGQGFPDFEPPQFVLDAGKKAFDGYQQYSPLAGMPDLLKAIATHTSKEWNHPIDPQREITTTVGATQGIYLTIQALINPNDEVLLIEPFYDSYPASVIMAGGIPTYVPLRPTKEKTWSLDFDELRRTITPKTKMLVLNTPQNPTGKVFSLDELKIIADICQEYDLLVLADEVYEKILFDGLQHHSIATLPGMWERTITLRSVGKTFSVTGWKVGWAIAPPPLTHALQMAHQWIPFSISSVLQNAVASIMQQSETNGYYDDLTALYQQKRDFFVNALKKANLEPFVPQGTYFIIADTEQWGRKDDEDFCHYMVSKFGVAAIPPSHFYSPKHQYLAKNLVRFAFCKQDHILQTSAQRLQQK